MKSWQDYQPTMKTEAPQFRYARDGELEALQRWPLALAHAQIEAKNHKGYSALMLAAYHGHAEVVRHLLECGADPNSADHAGSAVLNLETAVDRSKA